MKAIPKAALQSRFSLLPPSAKVLSKEIAVVREGGEVGFFNASGPICLFSETDVEGLRLAAAMLCEMGLVRPTVIAEALGLNRNRIFESRKRFRSDGAAGVPFRKRGPRGPSKLKGEILEQAQECIGRGLSNRATAAAVGVAEGTIRSALADGRLVARKDEDELSGTTETREARPRQRTEEDMSCAGGVAVKRVGERVFASMGLLDQARPEFKAAEAVPKAGVLLALPALLAQGLLEAAHAVYGELRNGFFGLQSVLLTLAFMAMLRIKTVENLTAHAPGDFGLVLGLDRAPEVKTVRRKLKEIGDRGKAFELVWELSRRWAEEDPDALGYLYVDGHVRPYHGGAHRLPKAFVPQRRLSMPATTDFWINDAQAAPLFFVTAEANDHLLTILEDEVFDKVRELVGEHQRITLVFDREGWSPDRFNRWRQNGIDVITYRRGKYDPWDEVLFVEHELTVAGRKEVYKLAERLVELRPGFEVREVRRLCDSGHQTAVITTCEDPDEVEIARRMFARWKQENFFRYMAHEFDLNHLPTVAVEPADPDRLVPNPAKKQKKAELSKIRRKLSAAQKQYGKQAVADVGRQRVTKTSRAKVTKQLAEIRELEMVSSTLTSELGALPDRVPLKDILGDENPVKLETERKTFTDAVKMVAYRAETQLANLVGPLLPSQADEARVFLKEAFQLHADLVPDEVNQRLTVRLYGMANWRSNRVLQQLCQVLNDQATCFPSSSLQLLFETVSDQ